MYVLYVLLILTFFYFSPMADGAQHVGDLLNSAQSIADESEKVKLLHQIQELTLEKDPSLLDNFLEEVLQFANDTSHHVRKFVAGFIEEACKKDERSINDMVIASLHHLLDDPNVNVLKRDLQANSNLFPRIFRMACNNPHRDDIGQMWSSAMIMKDAIKSKYSHKNIGVKVATLKFLESAVIAFSLRTAGSAKARGLDVSLDQVPVSHPFMDSESMQREGREIMASLCKTTETPKIPQILLTSVIQALSNIARQRPIFMDLVVSCLTTFSKSPPIGISASTVNNANRVLKIHMFALLEHSATTNTNLHCHELLIPALEKLGKPQQELNKLDRRAEARRQQTALSLSTNESSESPASGNIQVSGIVSSFIRSREQADTIVDGLWALHTTTDVSDASGKKCPSSALVELVMRSLEYCENYPDYRSWKQSQDKAIAVQFAAAKAAAKAAATKTKMADPRAKRHSRKRALDSEPKNEEGKLESKLDDETKERNSNDVIKKNTKYSEVSVVPSRKRRRFHAGSLLYSDSDRLDLLQSTFTRIMKPSLFGDKDSKSIRTREKLIARLVSRQHLISGSRNGILTSLIMEFILENIANRRSFALVWLHQEYRCAWEEMVGNGSETRTSLHETPGYKHYEQCILKLLGGVKERLPLSDRKFERLIATLILDLPAIPVSVIDLLSSFCVGDDCRIGLGITTLIYLVIYRPPLRSACLNEILLYTRHSDKALRKRAVDTIKTSLYKLSVLRADINEFIINGLNMLKDEPNEEEMGFTTWNEEKMKQYLYLCHEMWQDIPELLPAMAQAFTRGDVLCKKCISRALEGMIQRMFGKTSAFLLDLNCIQTPVKYDQGNVDKGLSQLISLIGEFPDGADNLILKILFVITSYSVPSRLLVKTVQGVYNHNRNAQFMIPMLFGLTSSEIVSLLPEFLRLSEMPRKAVMKLLLNPPEVCQNSPISPSELLVALVGLEGINDEALIETVNTCFTTHKAVYGQEVLASALQRLVDRTPLPRLFMRVVLLSLRQAPNLNSFVMHLLKRLVRKEVCWFKFRSSFLPLQCISNLYLFNSPVTDMGRFHVVERISHLFKNYMSYVCQRSAGPNGISDTRRTIERHFHESTSNSRPHETVCSDAPCFAKAPEPCFFF